MNTYTSQTNVVLIDGYSNSSNSSSVSPFTCSTSSSDDEASLPSSSDEENAFPKSLQSFEIESKKKRKKHKTVTRSKSMDVSTDFLSERFWYDPIQILNQWRSFWLGANVISWIAVMICTILTLLLLTIGTQPGSDTFDVYWYIRRVFYSLFMSSVAGIKTWTVWYPVCKEAYYRSLSYHHKTKKKEQKESKESNKEQKQSNQPYRTSQEQKNARPINQKRETMSRTEKQLIKQEAHAIARPAYYVGYFCVAIVFISCFVKRLNGRNGNSESWVCGGSSSNTLFVTFAALEMIATYMISPLLMYSVLLTYPHHRHRHHHRYHDKKKDQTEQTQNTDSNNNNNKNNKNNSNCCSSISKLCHLFEHSTTDTLFSKVSVSLVCLYICVAHLLELVGYDIVKFAPYALIYVVIVVAIDSGYIKNGAKPFSPIYAILFAMIVLAMPSGFMSFLRDIFNRIHVDCHHAMEYDYTTIFVYAVTAGLIQIVLLLTIHISSIAFGSRRNILYGGIVRMMGDIFSGLVLLEVVPFSSQFFLILVVKFCGRLALDLDWVIYFPAWLFKQTCHYCCGMCCISCRDSTGKDEKEDEKLKDSDVEAKTQEYSEQFELSYLSLYTEAVALSAIILCFLAAMVVGGFGTDTCTTKATCPYYQPVLNIDLFARLISCPSKINNATGSFFLMWVICGLRVGVQKSFFHRRFCHLPQQVQIHLLKETKASKHIRKTNSDLKMIKEEHPHLANRTSHQHALTIDNSGTIVLENQHIHWKMLAGISVVVQIFVAITSLNIVR